MTDRALKDEHFIEAAHRTYPKKGGPVCGDTFVSKKIRGGTRVISVLSDGLGSGIKASVLSTLTTSMAVKFVSEDVDIEKAAVLIMETLPMCRLRKIAYSTFTIVDMNLSGSTRIVEYDNPACILIRNRKIVPLDTSTVTVHRDRKEPFNLRLSTFQTKVGDRIVLVSDGVTQSGLGRPGFLMGWEEQGLCDFLENAVQKEPNISASGLCKQVVDRALRNDGNIAADDISCGVVYVRAPRKTLVLTGPPSDPSRDVEAACLVRDFKGTKIISGGTTAKIVARELNREIQVSLDDMTDISRGIPPGGTMQGVDLLTEGTITLSAASSMLENETLPEGAPKGTDAQTAALLLASDHILFAVGTRINQAHQDPHLPKELDIRRNVIRRIAALLEKKYLKKVEIVYF